MRILILGANGQLGRCFKKYITDVNLETSHDFVFLGKNEVDLLDLASVRIFFSREQDFDFVLNCAAFTDVEKAESNQDIANRINFLAVAELANICNAHNYKLIHISTDFVFDGVDSKAYGELCKTNPINVYGKSKLLGEESILTAMPENALIIRTSWLYSDYGENFVRKILQLGAKNKEVFVVNDQYGSPTHAMDLAEFIWMLLMHSKFAGGNFSSEIYHFSNEGKISWFDFVNKIVKVMNKDFNVIPVSHKKFKTIAARPNNSYLSKRKVREELNMTIPKLVRPIIERM